MRSKKLISAYLSAIIALSAVGGITPMEVSAGYTDSDGSYTWTLTDIADEIGYNDGDFNGGKTYDYEGLKITGGAGATISEDGVSFGKNAGYIAYTPESDGTLTAVVQADENAEIYIDESVYPKTNLVLKAELTDEYKADTELEAGKTYYIYNGSSRGAYIEQLVFESESEASPEPTETLEPYDHVWELTGIEAEVGYDESVFQSGSIYEYNGISIAGGAGATISEDGVSFGKNAGYIAYTPESDGTLTAVVQADENAEIYVDELLYSKANLVLKAELTDEYKVDTELEARKTYYIYNGSSRAAYIKMIAFDAAENIPTSEPTQTVEPTSEPTATAEAQTPEPTATLEPYDYVWELTGIEAEVGYDESAFQSGSIYEYNGISIAGGAGATITENGVSFGKNAGYIAYTPENDGTLTAVVQADENAEIYIDESVYPKTNIVLKAELTDEYKVDAELEAGKTYYIYNGSSRAAYIKMIAFDAAENIPTSEPTQTVEPTSEPTATAEAQTPEPTQTAEPTATAEVQTPEPTATLEPHDYIWDITDIADKIEYDEEDFQAGMVYDYNGILIAGAAGSSITDRGVSFGKNAGYILYTPDKFGILEIEVEAIAEAELYVDNAMGYKSNLLLKTSADGEYTASMQLEADKSYYIYNGSSRSMYIKTLSFDVDDIQPTRTPGPPTQTPGAETPTPAPTFAPVEKPDMKPSEEQQLDAVNYTGGTYIINDTTTYPISPANLDNKYDIVAGMDTSKTGSHFTFDLTFNTPVKMDTRPDTEKAYDGFALEFTNSKAKGGGVLCAAEMTEIDGEEAMTLKWRSGGTSWTMSDGKGIKIGKTYTFDFTVKPVEIENGTQTYYLDLDIYDENGRLYESATDLSCRAASGYVSTILLEAEPRTVGAEDSVTFSNIKTYLAAPVQTFLRSDRINGGDYMDNDQEYEIVAEDFTDTVVVFDAPLSILADGTLPDYITNNMTFTMADGSELADGLSAEGTELIAAAALPSGEYDIYVTISAEYNGAEVLRQQYAVKLIKEAVSPNDIMERYVPSITSNGEMIQEGSDIYEDLELPQSNSLIILEWSSSDENVIDFSGAVSRPLEDTLVTVTAVIRSAEDPEKSKTYEVTVNVKGTGEMLRDALSQAKAALVSADDPDKKIDTEVLAELHEDIKLYTQYVNETHKGYEEVSYLWETDNNALRINGDTAEIYPEDTNEHKVTLRLTAKFGDTEITEEIPVIVHLTPDNAAAKYAVRCDDTALANFEIMDDYDGQTVSESIELPLEGIFGSDISWTSSVPMYMSNTGEYTQPSRNTNVVLTGVVSKDNVMSSENHVYRFTLKGKNTSSASSGGGGSSSSSGGGSFTAVAVPKDEQNAAAAGSQTTGQNAAQRGFTDLADAAWAAEAINALAEIGVISGRTETSFAPNDNVTRAEFAKIVINAFMLGDDSAAVDVFSDVSEDDWYYTYIASAYSLGIINGYDDGTFGVNDNITRQDMAVIIYRAAQADGMELNVDGDDIDFEDKEDISDYAAEAVSELVKAGIINGISDTEFAPLSNATRAQAAKMVYELIK